MAIECINCGKRCSNLSGATRHFNHCIRRKRRRLYARHPVIQFEDRLAEFEVADDDNRLTSGRLAAQQTQLAQEVDPTDGYTGFHTCEIFEIEANVEAEAEAVDTQSDDDYTASRISSRGRGLLSLDSTYTTTSFEEATGIPAGTAISIDKDGPSALYNNSGLTVAQVLDTDNFYPFDNEFQYSLSVWFLESRLSAGAIDSYIRNEAINPQGRPFKDCKQWLSILESIPYGIHNDTWQRVSIEFPDELDNGTGRYMLYYRDVTQVIKFLISYLPFRDYLHYAPVRLYTEDAEGKPQRVYTELYTADWWWTTQEKLAAGATIVPVLVASDKTMMTQHRGDRSMWPIYLSIGNLDGEVRRSQKLPGSILIGLIPVPTGGSGWKRELYHKAMGLILEPLISLSQTGIAIQCADRKSRRCYPILAGFMCDYEEQVLITCVKSIQHCTICEVPATKREKLRLKWPLRTHESMQLQIRRQRRQKMDKGDPSWVHPTENFSWAHPYTNIHQAMMMDILHQLYKGVVDHMNRWVNKYFARKSRHISRPRADRGILRKTFTIRLDYRFKQVPPFTGLKRFNNQRFSKVRQWTGNEYRDMIRQYAAVIAPLIEREDAGVMLFIRAVLDFVTLSEYHSHTDETLEYLNHALERIDDLKYTLQVSSSGKPINFNFPKFHVLSHYTDFIRDYGSLVNHNSSVQENFHKILLKEYYNRTNKQDNYEEQILKHNTRRVNVQAMQGILSFRSTTGTIDENHSSLDSRSNNLSPSMDLTGYPLTDASRTRLEELGLSQRSWRLVVDIASRFNIDGLIEAIAIFVQEHRAKRGQTNDGVITHHGRVHKDYLSRVARLPMQLHSSLSCYKLDGKDTRDPNKRTKETIRCSEDWRKTGSPRYDFVWVQEYGCLDNSTSEVQEIQGRMIGKSIMFITVMDVEVECGQVLGGEAPRYYGAVLNMMRLRNKGRANAIHGMIEVEDFPDHTAPGRNGKIRCYDIQTVHRSVHAVPAGLDDNNDNKKLWYVNNFIDWDSYNTLFNSDWREENKREVTKVKRVLRRR